MNQVPIYQSDADLFDEYFKLTRTADPTAWHAPDLEKWEQDTLTDDFLRFVGFAKKVREEEPDFDRFMDRLGSDEPWAPLRLEKPSPEDRAKYLYNQMRERGMMKPSFGMLASGQHANSDYARRMTQRQTRRGLQAFARPGLPLIADFLSKAKGPMSNPLTRVVSRGLEQATRTDEPQGWQEMISDQALGLAGFIKGAPSAVGGFVSGALGVGINPASMKMARVIFKNPKLAHVAGKIFGGSQTSALHLGAAMATTSEEAAVKELGAHFWDGYKMGLLFFGGSFIGPGGKAVDATSKQGRGLVHAVLKQRAPFLSQIARQTFNRAVGAQMGVYDPEILKKIKEGRWEEINEQEVFDEMLFGWFSRKPINKHRFFMDLNRLETEINGLRDRGLKLKAWNPYYESPEMQERVGGQATFEGRVRGAPEYARRQLTSGLMAEGKPVGKWSVDHKLGINVGNFEYRGRRIMIAESLKEGKTLWYVVSDPRSKVPKMGTNTDFTPDMKQDLLRRLVSEIDAEQGPAEGAVTEYPLMGPDPRYNEQFYEIPGQVRMEPQRGVTGIPTRVAGGIVPDFFVNGKGEVFPVAIFEQAHSPAELADLVRRAQELRQPTTDPERMLPESEAAKAMGGARQQFERAVTEGQIPDIDFPGMRELVGAFGAAPPEPRTPMQGDRRTRPRDVEVTRRPEGEDLSGDTVENLYRRKAALEKRAMSFTGSKELAKQAGREITPAEDAAFTGLVNDLMNINMELRKRGVGMPGLEPRRGDEVIADVFGEAEQGKMFTRAEVEAPGSERAGTGWDSIWASKNAPVVKQLIGKTVTLMQDTKAYTDSNLYDGEHPLPKKGGLAAAQRSTRYKTNPDYRAWVDSKIKEVVGIMEAQQNLLHRMERDIAADHLEELVSAMPLEKPELTGGTGVISEQRSGDPQLAWFGQSMSKYAEVTHKGDVSLREATQNAIDAAIMAVESGKVKTGEVHIDSSSTRGYTIRDNGIGMSEMDLRDKFLDLHASGKREGTRGLFGRFGTGKAIQLAPTVDAEWSIRTRDVYTDSELTSQKGEIQRVKDPIEGTIFTIESPKSIMTPYAPEHYIKTIDLPRNIKIFLDGKEIKKGLFGKKHKSYTEQVNDDTTMEITFYKKPLEYALENRLVYRIVDPQTGLKLTQKVEWLSTSGMASSDMAITVDLKTKAQPGTGNYPMSDNRWSLTASAKEYLNEVIKNNTKGGGADLGPEDSSGGKRADYNNKMLTDLKQWREMMQRVVVKNSAEYTKLLNDFIEVGNQAGLDLRPQRPTEWKIDIVKGYKGYKGGSEFHLKYLMAMEAALKITSKATGIPQEGIGVAFGSFEAIYKPWDHTVMINPVAMPKSALGSVERMAEQLRMITSHELVHREQSGHDEMYIRRRETANLETAEFIPQYQRLAEIILGKESKMTVLEREYRELEATRTAEERLRDIVPDEQMKFWEEQENAYKPRRPSLYYPPAKGGKQKGLFGKAGLEGEAGVEEPGMGRRDVVRPDQPSLEGPGAGAERPGGEAPVSGGEGGVRPGGVGGGTFPKVVFAGLKQWDVFQITPSEEFGHGKDMVSYRNVEVTGFTPSGHAKAKFSDPSHGKTFETKITPEVWGENFYDKSIRIWENRPPEQALKEALARSKADAKKITVEKLDYYNSGLNLFKALEGWAEHIYDKYGDPSKAPPELRAEMKAGRAMAGMAADTVREERRFKIGRRVLTNLYTMGKGGEKIGDASLKFIKNRAQAEQYDLYRFMTAFDALSKEIPTAKKIARPFKIADKVADKMFDLMEGKLKPKTPGEKYAYEVIDTIRKEIGQRSQELGLKIGTITGKANDWVPMKDYAPVEYTNIRRFLESKSFRHLRDMYIEEIAKKLDPALYKADKAKAIMIAENNFRELKAEMKSRKFGHLEYERVLDDVILESLRVRWARLYPKEKFPLERKRTLDVWVRYFTGARERLAWIESFGKDMYVKGVGYVPSKLRNMRMELSDANYGYVETIFSRYLKQGAPLDTRLVRMLRGIRTYQLTKLAFAFIPNSLQWFTNTIPQVDLKSAAETLIDVAKYHGVAGKEIKRRQRMWFSKTGAQTYKHAFSMTMLDNPEKLSKFADIMLRVHGFSGTESFNAVFAAHAGARHAIRISEKLYDASKKQSGLKWYRRKFYVEELKKYGLKPEDIAAIAKDGPLTFEKNAQNLFDAGFHMRRTTQFLADMFHLPASWSTPFGRLLTQFKNFSYNQTALVYEAAKEMGKFAKTGGKEGTPMQLMKMMPALTLAGALIHYFKKKAYPALGMHFYEELTAGKSWPYMVGMYLANSGGLGMLMDISNAAAFGGSSMIDMIGGPTTSDLRGFFQASADTIQELQVAFEYQYPGWVVKRRHRLAASWLKVIERMSPDMRMFVQAWFSDYRKTKEFANWSGVVRDAYDRYRLLYKTKSPREADLFWDIFMQTQGAEYEKIVGKKPKKPSEKEVERWWVDRDKAPLDAMTMPGITPKKGKTVGDYEFWR